MKKLVITICLLLIGGGITALVDDLIGLKFDEVGGFVQLVHKFIYMFLGGVVGLIMGRLGCLKFFGIR